MFACRFERRDRSRGGYRNGWFKNGFQREERSSGLKQTHVSISCSSDCIRDYNPTFCWLPEPFCSASKPPGPRLLLRDFLSAASFLDALLGILLAVTSLAGFSFSPPDPLFEAGICAIERRARMRLDPAEDPFLEDDMVERNPQNLFQHSRDIQN